MAVSERGDVGRRLGAAGAAAYGWMRRSALPGLNQGYADLQRFAARAPVRFLAYLLLGFSFLFMIFPGIDLAVSGWFAAPEGGFPLSRDETLRFIRDVNRVVPSILILGLVAMLLLHALRPTISWLVRPHQALFVISVYALGAGVIVHLLKTFVGRARPETITEFGGERAFTVAWQFSSACARNCSFSSGEAASAMAMLALALIVPRAFRLLALIILVPLGFVFSVNRIAFGSHFISDVVISWLIVLMVMIVLWRVFREKAEVIDRAVIGSGLPVAAYVSATARRMVVLVRERLPLRLDRV